MKSILAIQLICWYRGWDDQLNFQTSIPAGLAPLTHKLFQFHIVMSHCCLSLLLEMEFLHQEFARYFKELFNLGRIIISIYYLYVSPMFHCFSFI